MFRELKPTTDLVSTGYDALPHVPAHWEMRQIRSLIRSRSERDRIDLPLLSVARERGVFVRAADDENHNAIPDDLTNYKLARKGDLVINKMKAWQGSLGLAPEDGIVSPAYYVYDFAIENRHFGQALLRSKPYVAMLGAASDGVRIGQWDLSVARFRELPVLIPPGDEQAAIVKYLAHAHARIDRAIAAKRKLIALLEEQKQAIIQHAVTRGLDPSVPLKDSGIPWLGEIPAHWEVRRLKDLCIKIIDCKNRTPEEVEGGQYTVVRTSCIRAGKFTTDGSYQTDKHQFEEWTARGAPRPGDVFFTREAPMGEAAMVPDRIDLCMGQRMMYFRPDPTVLDATFLLHTIYGPIIRSYIATTGTGSTVGHLRLGQVANLPILVGPASEQRQISRHIADLTAPIEAVQARGREEIELLREFRTRLTSDVVTGQVDVRAIAATLPELTDDLLASADDEFGGDDELHESELEFAGANE